MRLITKSSLAIAPVALLICAAGAPVHAASPSAAPVVSPSASPSAMASSTSKGSPTPSPTQSPRRGLTQAQKDALALALTTYKASIQSALDGAHRAIADAQSIRDQALAAAPKDKNVRSLAFSDFKNTSNQIWSAFKEATGAAKALYDSTVSTIKATR